MLSKLSRIKADPPPPSHAADLPEGRGVSAHEREAATAPGIPSGDCPLFVDLDGTLLASDTLYETALSCIRREPGSWWRWPLWLLRGRARLKAELAARAAVDVTTLPYDRRLCEWLRAERERGRRVYLATAADGEVARAVADHLGLFDGVIASDCTNNLKGLRKLEAIRRVAAGPFAYAGNGPEDLPIWAAAASAVVANASPTLERHARDVGRVDLVLQRRGGQVGELWRAMRPHQWIKNSLILVPLLTSFRFDDTAALLGAASAFIAFCLCASATYILNDLLDLDADRAHPRKQLRPFASGRASVPGGLLLAAGLTAAGLGIAAAHSLALLGAVASYLVVTSAYSLKLKHYALLDAVVLSSLYTWRLFAGIVATGVQASVWLLAFALFIFLSLALLKRCAELVMQESAGAAATRGRDYRVSDLRVLWPLGISLGVCSIVVFVLYATAPEVRARYASPMLLWLVAVGLVYWMARMWLKTSRGEMTDDPIVYALKDFGSRMTVAAMVAVTLLAHAVRFGA